MCGVLIADRVLLNKIIMKAIWNNKVIAESNNTIVVENNHYFPESSIDKDFFIFKK